MENLVVTGSPAFAGDDDREVNDPSEKSSLVRSAARQPRCVRDDLARALSELSEIDGRDPAALLKQRGYHHLGVRDGPPFVLMLFSRSLFVRHGNTKRSPRALLFINERSSLEFPAHGSASCLVPNYILNSLIRERLAAV
jgi:hypothetical protein